MNRSLGIYIHIPFCIKKCAYCDFCSFPNSKSELMSEYADELCRRISKEAHRAVGYTVDTVYFGGGTPSLLPVQELKKLLRAVGRCFCVSESAEITLECNPATADRQKLAKFRALGFNRLSIGLQSAIDSELRLLGRAHTAAEFVCCYEDARAAGFDNISADLMYGIPEQTPESLVRSIELLTSLHPEHISAYGLMLEEGTELYRRRSSLAIADDDGQAELYHLLCNKLSEAGYKKYEISNFSLPSFESRHNLRYWRTEEYLGFGVAAHSYFNGERYGNSRDICAFLKGLDISCEREKISEDDARKEYVMLGLRLCEGIDGSVYKARFGRELDNDFSFEKYIGGGFMIRNGDRICFTESGFLVSNTILCELLA